MSDSRQLSQADLDHLLDQIRVPTPVKVGGVMLLFDGLLVAVLALQNLILVRWVGFYTVLAALLLAPSLAAMFVGARLVRARGWAMTAALVVGGLLLLANCVWFTVMLFNGLFTGLGAITVALGVSALVFLGVAVRPFRQVADARRQLRDAGHDVDL